MTENIEEKRKIWRAEIEKALGQEGDVPLEDVARDYFIEMLLFTLPKAIANVQIYENPSDIKRTLSHLEKIIKLSKALDKIYHHSPSLQNSCYWADSEMREVFKAHINLELIYKYCKRLWLFQKDLLSAVNSPNRNNLPALMICELIAEIYHISLGQKPSISNYDYSKETGDILTGTKFEKVVRTISKLEKFDIAWSTIKKSAKTYRDKDKEYLKRMEKSYESASILDDLKFQ